MRFIPYLATFIAGVFYALGFPTKVHNGSLLLPIVGMSLLFYFLEIGKVQKSFKTLKGLLLILIFSLGYNLVGYYWIPYTLSEFGEIHFPYNQILSIFFSLIIAPHLYAFYLIERKLGQYYPKLESYKIPILALLFVLCEQIIPQQFPAHLGHPWLVVSPYLGAAPYFGAPFYSFLNCLIVLILSFASVGKNYIVRAAILAGIILNFSLPKLEAPSKEFSTDRTPFLVRFVQGNIGNYLKLSSESGEYSSISEVIQSFKQLSVAPTDKPIDLILWPETSYPLQLNIDRLQKGLDYTPSVFYEIVADMGSEIFFGGYDEAIAESSTNALFKSEYNASFHIDVDGNVLGSYRKMKLIPFGESLPFGPLNSYLSEYLTNIAFFAEGEEPKLFTHAKGVRFTAAICYEILFTNFIRGHLNHFKDRPAFIVNLTNDSWYGDTSEPRQHLFLSKWRALEYQLPILRMTNTGITSVIFEDGSESARLGVGEKNHLDIQIFAGHTEATLYQRFGIWLTIVIALGLVVLLGIFKQKTFFKKVV
jgi:apolipoprotein N-acyltransferase